jgi:hypothetical protein
MLTAGCGEAAAPSLLRGEPATYLLTVDQMVSPDFTVDVAPHQLAAGAYVAAAAEEFFRSTGSLADSNGPVQVRDTVEAFSSTTSAATTLAADSARLDAVAGATAISTGPLGDQAHATAVTAATSASVRAIEITVEWRVENLVDIIVVRGREGGTRLADALVLAHRQTVIELGLATPVNAWRQPRLRHRAERWLGLTPPSRHTRTTHRHRDIRPSAMLTADDPFAVD